MSFRQCHWSKQDSTIQVMKETIVIQILSSTGPHTTPAATSLFLNSLRLSRPVRSNILILLNSHSLIAIIIAALLLSTTRYYEGIIIIVVLIGDLAIRRHEEGLQLREISDRVHQIVKDLEDFGLESNEVRKEVKGRRSSTFRQARHLSLYAGLSETEGGR